MLDNYCPAYMMYGMSYDEYWQGSLEMHKAYRKKYEFAERKQNEHMWLMGIYMQCAIGSCFSKDAKYPDSPIPITEAEMEEYKAREAQKKASEFASWASRFNQKLKDKGGEHIDGGK